MTAPAKAAKTLSFRRLSRRALTIGMVKASDKAMKFLLPVVLVRCLDTATFGEYRLLWLVVGTVMTIATLNMAGGLNYFLPRSDAPRKRLYVHHTMLFLALSALVFAALAGPWNPFLPEAIAPLAKYGALVPAFVGLWVAAILLDFLPTIDERVRWQAWASVGTSLLRVALIAAGAFLTGDLAVVMALMLVAVGVKLALLLYYVWRYHGLGKPWFERAAFSDQFRHLAPFGVAGALYGLRGQADQWVAAALFSLHSFAAFSVASVLNSLVVVFRRSVVEAFLPNMSRLQAAGDVRGMMSLNSRANVMIGTLLYPALAFVFAFANEIVTLVYTANYLEAVPVMRVYIAGICVLVLEIGSVLLLLRQGAFALGANAIALAASVATSLALASTVGLAGAAGGSVLAVMIDRSLMLRRISKQVGIPMRELQDWRGIAVAFCYALASAALIDIAVDLLAYDRGPFMRLALGACGLALAYLPIAWRLRGVK
jgi:O-antigen/teichoic acid export membrane protein